MEYPMFNGWVPYPEAGIKGIAVLRNSSNGSLAAFKDGEFIISVTASARAADDLKAILPLALSRK